jgi:hypothetical protein
MVFPAFTTGGAEVGGPEGHTYAAVLVRGAGRDDVLRALRALRFTGWVAPPDRDWVVAAAVPGTGPVAAGRRGVAGVAERLAADLDTTTLAARVRSDRQLLLAMWTGGDEVGRYLSDPSREPDADEDVLPDPVGAEHAAAFAAACDRPMAAGDLAELLDGTLDPDSTIESERLGAVLRRLGLPTWPVAAAALPRDIPTGPGRRDLVRLGAGVPGLPGIVLGRAANTVRRRRSPPPVVPDPPRGSTGMDPWLM